MPISWAQVTDAELQEVVDAMGDMGMGSTFRDYARAVSPIIERQVRKQVAAELRAQKTKDFSAENYALENAADAVERKPETFAEDRPVGLVPDPP